MKQFILAIALLLVASVSSAADQISITISPEGAASETFTLNAPAGTLSSVIEAFADKGWSEGMTDDNDEVITQVRWFAIALKNFALAETRSYLKRQATRAAEVAVDTQADALSEAITVVEDGD